jgi:hypothetical protein
MPSMFSVPSIAMIPPPIGAEFDAMLTPPNTWLGSRWKSMVAAVLLIAPPSSLALLLFMLKLLDTILSIANGST